MRKLVVGDKFMYVPLKLTLEVSKVDVNEDGITRYWFKGPFFTGDENYLKEDSPNYRLLTKLELALK